jgi:hypothetical protein
MYKRAVSDRRHQHARVPDPGAVIAGTSSGDLRRGESNIMGDRRSPGRSPAAGVVA